MIQRLAAYIHHRRGHTQGYARVSVPMFDSGARGVLVKCDCGKAWAW